MLENLIQGTWHDLLLPEMKSNYFQELEKALLEDAVSYDICPRIDNIFRALNLCLYEETKVVIIGQDPYMNLEQADGLAFSVRENIRIPPTLLNIFKCLNKDLGCSIPNNGNLDYWAKQGVLLLNSVLTTRDGYSKAHHRIGWQQFTDQIVYILNESNKNLVFMLWGREAKKKKIFIDPNKHLILSGPHPSPIIANNKFTDYNFFSQANKYLYEISPTTIDWQIPNI